MYFVPDDTCCAMVWLYENSDCRNHNRIDNCWGNIVLSEFIHPGKELL